MSHTRGLLAKLEMELRSGERVVWSCQPIPSRYARGSWALTVFGIFWTAFAIFWITGASMGFGNAPGLFRFFPLFGVPFVIIGLGMITAPFWARKKAAGVIYAITDQRAIILETRLRGALKIQSFPPAELTSLTRVDNNDGSGDVIFRTERRTTGKGRSRLRHVGFMAVPAAKAVEEDIRKLAQKAHPAKP